MGAETSSIAALKRIAFSDLPGWAEDDHSAAFAAFRSGTAVLHDYPPKARQLGIDAAALALVLARAAELPGTVSGAEARRFFETAFQPVSVGSLKDGFFTGYYEPEVAGSRSKTAAFPVPLYRAPSDLVEIAPGEAPTLDPSFRFARKTATGFSEFPDRAAIMAGVLADQKLELVYIADAVEAFFIHVQGAARIRLADGTYLRVTYSAKSGHPYTPIGRIIADKAGIPRQKVTMETIRMWLAEHPAEADAVMAANRSFIFFREAAVGDALGPIAAAKVPLVAGRSLAVDRLQHAFHTPVWIETALPSGAPFRRLTVAHDTGSAIVGPARGDIFFGSGDAAGAIAGAMRASGRFVVLMPRATP
jgi:membrane-bound lytic murein transglycosylase A